VQVEAFERERWTVVPQVGQCSKASVP
jgi:hypothetical protein